MERILFNVPEISPKEDYQNSFFLSVKSMLEYLGYKFDYEFLMGVSLHAFRTNIYPDLSLSSTDPFSGFNTGEYLLNVLDIDWETRMGSEDDKDASLTVMKIVDSINRGVPVIAIHIDYTENWGIINGYGENVSNFYGLFFNQETSGSKIVTSWPFIAVIAKSVSIKKDREKIVKDALENFSYILTPGIVSGYYNGKLALEYILENKLYESEEERTKLLLDDLLRNRKIAHSFLEKYGKYANAGDIPKITELYKLESLIKGKNWTLEEKFEKLLIFEEKILDKL